VSLSALRLPDSAAEIQVMPGKVGKRKVVFLLRLGFAVFLLAVLVRMVDFHQMGLMFASVKPEPIIAALLIMLLNYGLKTYRWAAILWIQRPDIPFAQLARFNFVSIFFGSFLPSSVSADIVRVYYVAQHTADPRAAISSIFADRIIGSFALAIVTIAAFLVLLETGLFPIGSVLSYGIGAFLFLALGLPFALRNATVLHAIIRLFERFAGRRLFASVKDMSDHLCSYGSARGTMIQVFAISLVNLFIAVLEFYLIATGFSAQVSIGYFFVFIPLVIFLATLPVSVGGMGLVEGGLVFFLSKAGMPVEMCLGTCLVYRALQLVCLLPGAAIYLFNGASVKELPA
jgi:glycosyltransferase 2 family protein